MDWRLARHADACEDTAVNGLARLVFPDGTETALGGLCSLGRSRDNTIRLDSPLVGRRHAIIQCQNDGEFWLVDLGSCNGTQLNGRPVERPVGLRDGDVIEVAGAQFTFRSAAGAAVAYDDTISARSTIPQGAVKRDCWLLVADIVGGVRRALELPDEELPRVNGEWFRACREVVDDHGGYVNQYLGDGFLCYWQGGAEAGAGVLASLRRLAMLQAQAAPKFRLAVHFGPVVLAKLPTMSVINLHGPTVNFVFRMEKLAAKLGAAVLCSEPAWNALQVPAHACHQSGLAGFDESFRFFVPDLGD